MGISHSERRVRHDYGEAHSLGTPIPGSRDSPPPALTSLWRWNPSNTDNPKFTGPGRPLVLTGSSPSQWEVSKSLSLLSSQVPWGMCPHPLLPLRSLHPLPDMTMLEAGRIASARLKSLCPVSRVPCPANRQGLMGPQAQREALSCNKANTASRASARGMPLPLLSGPRVPGFEAEKKISV